MKTNQRIAQAITQKVNSNSGVAKMLTAKNNILLLNNVFTTAIRLAADLQSQLKNLRKLR